MGIAYYGFTLFIFGLVCCVLVVYKLLFSDIRKQQKLLDEKEAKLLKLYQSLEDMMEEYYDAADQLKKELDTKLKRLEAPAYEQGARPPEPEPPPREQLTMIAEDFKQTLKKAQEAPEPPKQEVRNAGGKESGRREEIMRLVLDGLSTPQIAKELNITQNEVALTIGLMGK